MLSPYRYPGAKNKLLPQIMPFIESSLQKTNKFCDAFVGGGSVLLEVATKYKEANLFANDKDWFVFCFWKVLSSNSEKDINSLHNLIAQKPTIELYYTLRENEPTTEVEAAYRAIFFNRTSFSGDMRRNASPIGGKGQSSKYTVDCRYNASKISKKIDHVHDFLKNRLLVTNQDINNFPLLGNKDVTIYLDPPYWQAGKQLYQEYMKSDEHKKMSENLFDRKDWILSYDNCDEIIDLYSWAKVHFIDVSYCIRGSKTNWLKTKEVLILPS